MIDEINKLEKELHYIKATQATMADSTNLYAVTYSPGELVGDGAVRNHTIVCHTYGQDDKAVFMPMFSNRFYIFANQPIGRYFTQPENIITWQQYGVNPAYSSNPAYTISYPKTLTIYSNVNFYIEASYIDL